MDDSVAEVVAAGVPVSFPEFVGRELHIRGEDMFAVRSKRGIENGGNRDVQPGGAGEFAVFGGVESALEIVDFRTDVNPAREGFERTRRGIERGENRQAAESKIDFGDVAIGAKVLDAIGESGIELRSINEMEESAVGVKA